MPSPSGHRRHRSSLSSDASRESGDETLTGTGAWQQSECECWGNNIRRSFSALASSVSRAAELVDEANLATSCPAPTQIMADLQFDLDLDTLRRDLEL